jgi:hypothetical protein
MFAGDLIAADMKIGVRKKSCHLSEEAIEKGVGLWDCGVQR